MATPEVVTGLRLLGAYCSLLVSTTGSGNLL
jgi:hypothetical protein